MATGIQTGIRRGSRISPQGSPPSPTTVLQRGLEGWRTLSPRIRKAVIATAILLQVAVLGLGWHSHSQRYVDLYPTKLNALDVPDVSRALLDMGIEHEVAPTGDSVLLDPAQRMRARAGLATRNLPLHPVMTTDQVPTTPGLTSDQRRAMEQRVLEGEITLALREVEGVQDARVKLAIPPKRYFKDAEEVDKASVILTLEPGVSLDREGIAGILNLVAYSVPGLLPANVQLTDTRRGDLSARIPRDGEGRIQLSGTHFEVSAAEERRIQNKVQETLDEILPGRTKLLVNLDLDFSTIEHRRYTPGSSQDDGLVKASVQLVKEMLDSGGKEIGPKETGPKKSFRNEKESANYKFTEDYYATLAKEARVQRVSASLFADGISPAEAGRLEKALRGALGIQDKRGDFLYVDTTPWDHALLADHSAEQAPAALETPGGGSFSSHALLVFFAAQVGLLLAAVGGFALFSARTRGESSPELGHGPGAMVTTGIVDHGRTKLGQTFSDVASTRAQTTEKLEGIVRERPGQVAELLRSTWLS